jgi:thiamine-phosphate pyrophosphorylase
MTSGINPTEQIRLARILDAAANRAREALRVLEDYCRFTLDDAFLSGELKRLRHELADALAVLQSRHLLEARETERDVGRELTASGEESRQSLEAVLQANCKRLQEALRSLEEFGKVRSPELGRTLEKLRYQSYTLERAITLGGLAREQLADVRLCVLITESACAGPMDRIIQEAAAGGAGMIQLREKHLSDVQLLECARKVRQWTSQAGILFIVNDRPDIARLANADGVHLGQDDMPVMEARQILGPDLLIGVSTHSMDQVRQAVLDCASYIGVGPTFPSGTKDFVALPGLEFVREAMSETSLPAFAIGGIGLDNIDQVAAAGVHRVAVSQAICQGPNPRRVAEEMLKKLAAHAP